MAKRRMFSMDIVDSDKFFDMPHSSQLLYFHLGMRADDDGFVDSPKKIMRMIGASEDDMRILLAKDFVIPFDSGICVIKHWRIHNYIRSDRYNETHYKTEKGKLIERNNIYHLTTSDIPDDIPNGSTGKVRLGKDSIGKYKDTSSKSDDLSSENKKQPSKTPKKKNTELAPRDDDENILYHSIQKAFLSKNGDRFTNYGKEGKAIKGLIKKAKSRHPDNPASFIYEMIKRLWELKNSQDKFWVSQPFLPSSLNASGIFDRVLETFRESTSYEMSEEELDELAKMVAT